MKDENAEGRLPIQGNLVVSVSQPTFRRHEFQNRFRVQWESGRSATYFDFSKVLFHDSGQMGYEVIFVPP
jgi:hypothetical protein